MQQATIASGQVVKIGSYVDFKDDYEMTGKVTNIFKQFGSTVLTVKTGGDDPEFEHNFDVLAEDCTQD